MQTQEMRLNYQEAIQLVRVGRYEEALRILEMLNVERPNIKNVLYPMAVCYEKLGRHESGIAVCNRLIEQFDHAEARLIKSRLELTISYPLAEEVESLEEKVEVEQASSTPSDVDTMEAGAPSTGKKNKHYKKPTWLVLLIALALAAIAAFVLLGFVLFR